MRGWDYANPNPNPSPNPNPYQAELPLREWQHDGRLRQATFEGIAIALKLAVFLLWLLTAASLVWEQLAPVLESISIYLSLPIYRSINPPSTCLSLS